MRTFGAICCFEVDIVLKKIACCGLRHGDALREFSGQTDYCCEEQGAEPVCMAAAWDSEKVDLLPAWNPDVRS
jgi:hypothetical protein